MDGRLIQLLGTNQPVNGRFGRADEDPATETPAAGSTEVWQIANLTGDTHPIHFPLVSVQVLARQPPPSIIAVPVKRARVRPGR
jgi:spore coat protein A, manganese oxidase